MTANTPTSGTTPDLLDVPGIAEYLTMSERQVRHVIAQRRVPVIKIGQLVRVRRTDLDAYLIENTREVAR